MVERALQGANFIDVFRGFLDAGQTEVESYRSAARVFRGGDPRGGVCFTKDCAYLRGLFTVYMFVLKAIQEGQARLLRMLFAGRLTTADVVTLDPYRAAGLILPATYVPPWAREPQRILALLAFFEASQLFRSDTFDLRRFVDSEDEAIAEAADLD